MFLFAGSLREIVSPKPIRSSARLGGVVAAALIILTPNVSFAGDRDGFKKYDERCNDAKLPAAEIKKACKIALTLLNRREEHIDQLLHQNRLMVDNALQAPDLWDEFKTYDKRCNDTNLTHAEINEACKMASKILKGQQEHTHQLARQSHLLVHNTLRAVSISQLKIRVLQQASPQR